MNSRKVIRLTFRRFRRKWVIWNNKKNARALCFWNCLCSNYFQFQSMQTIDNSDVFSCSFLWPDSFKKENEKKFAFLRNAAASVATYEITSFVATHNFYFKVISSKCVATTNRHDETRLQIHVVNRAFMEVAENSYLMSSLYSHLHFIVSVVWFESTYHFLSIFKWRFVSQSAVSSLKKAACVAYSVLQFRPPYNNLTQTHLGRLTKFFLDSKGKCFTIVEEWCRKSCFEQGTKKWVLSFRWRTHCRTQQSTWPWLGNQFNRMKLVFL